MKVGRRPEAKIGNVEPMAAFWPIEPVPAPRQAFADRWRKGRHVRPRVARYRAFRDEVVLRRVWQPKAGDLIVFLMPIPASRRRELLDGSPHQQVPDTDNLLKALLDALYEDDSDLWSVRAAKVWSTTPGIYIERGRPPISCPFLVPDHLVSAAAGSAQRSKDSPLSGAIPPRPSPNSSPSSAKE